MENRRSKHGFPSAAAFSAAVLAVISLTLLLARPAGAYQVSLQAESSRREVARGETFTYKLSIIEEGEADRPVRLDPPDFTGFNVTGNFTSSSTKVIENKARRVTEQEYRLSSDTPGERVIPPARLVIIDPKTGRQQEIPSNEVRVTVLEKGPGVLKGLQEDIRDIKGPKTFMDKVRYFFYFMSAIVALVLLALIGLAVYMVRRQKARHKAATPPAAPGSPRERALAALERAGALKADPKAYYSAVVEALRVYLKEVYSIPAVEATTSEIIDAAAKSALPPDARERLRELLNEADLVKFAKHVPGEEEKTKFMERAKHLLFF